MPTPDSRLSIGEVARRFGVAVDTVRRWESAGRIRATRTVGGQRRFLEADVEALLREDEKGAA